MKPGTVTFRLSIGRKRSAFIVFGVFIAGLRLGHEGSEGLPQNGDIRGFGHCVFDGARLPLWKPLVGRVIKNRVGYDRSRKKEDDAERPDFGHRV